ncbi:phosphotriesterase [Streptomyces sp. NPDC057743]|uniref:phosphotriesterase family protein n=1 Tax=Streptomyces sp. NPDC057743 TaxID=3346236 RepID=UPI00369DCDEB
MSHHPEDRPAPTIRTVTGPLVASAVAGPALAHEHLAIDLRRGGDQEAVLDSRHTDAVAAELSLLREQFGLALIVDQTCRGMGRDVDALVRIATAADIAVVAATGWYHEAFHPADLRTADIGLLTDTLVGDAEQGIGPSKTRPGLIGEVGSHGHQPSAPERRSLTAAARAAVHTGLSVATHASLGRGGLAQLQLLTNQGLPPHRIAIGHQDLLTDSPTHRALAAEGAYVAFDTLGKNSYQDDAVRLRLLLTLLDSGHADRILLSCDISRYAYLNSYGGTGYGHLFHSFLPRLRAAGVPGSTIDQLTRRNLLRFLSGQRDEGVPSKAAPTRGAPCLRRPQAVRIA